MGELIGMRWILWDERDEMPRERARGARADHRAACWRRPVTRVGLAATASYLPERWMTAAEVAAASGIPEDVIVEKFGLRGKHIAAADEHVSDLAVRAARAAARRDRRRPGRDRRASCTSARSWKDYPVWQAAPWIAHRLGCANAYAVEYDNVSCGAPVALRVARDMLVAEAGARARARRRGAAASRTSSTTRTSARASCSTSATARSRRCSKDGGAERAARLARDHRRLALAAGEGAVGRQRRPRTAASRFLDVADPAAMKERLDEVSLPNFVRAAEGALARSGATLADVGYLCGIHMKRSMHDGLAGGARRRSGARAPTSTTRAT